MTKTKKELRGMEEYPCSNCNGFVIYRRQFGWGHVICTGCLNPAVTMENWKRYLSSLKKGEAK